MRKAIILIILLIGMAGTGAAKDLPFRAERLITDFRGVATNGEITFCYGDYGIITFSDNAGKTWDQLSLGDKYSIKKIINVGMDFYGVTDFSLIKYDVVKKKWINKDLYEMPEIVSLAIRDSTMYVLTNSGVITSDFSLASKQDKMIRLGTDSEYSEIALDSGNVYIIAEDSTLFRYSINTVKLDTVRLAEMKLRSHCNKISNMKNIDGRIYALLEDRSYKHTYKTLVMTSDGGTSWKKVTDSIFGYAYTLIDNEMYEAYTMPDLLSPTIIPYLYKISGDGIRTRINSNDSGDRCFDYVKKGTEMFSNKPINGLMCDRIALTDMAKINKDTYIGVGKHKQVVMSYDGGISWKFKSLFFCFEPYQSSTTNPIYLSDSVIILRLYRTTDAGTTWLPPAKNPEIDPIKVGYFSEIFNKDGSGNLFSYNRVLKQMNCLLTSDYGETYKARQDTGIDIQLNYFSIYNYGGRNIIKSIINEKSKVSTIVYGLDENLRICDSTRLDSVNLGHIVEAEDGTLYGIGHYFYKDEKDSTIWWYMADGSCHLFKSTDAGKSWIKTLDPMPFAPLPTLDTSKKATRIFYNNYYYKGNILIPMTFDIIPRSQSADEVPQYLYIYNTKTSKMDSIGNPFGKAVGYRPFTRYSDIFNMNNMLLANLGDAIYYNNDIEGAPNNWDSIKLSNILYNWKPDFNYQALTMGVNYNLNTWSNGKTAYFLTGTLVRFYDGSTDGYSELNSSSKELNLVKLRPVGEEVSVREESKAEIAGNYFYSFPPYPIPACQRVSAEIYWDTSLGIESAEIEVYNMFGEKVASRDRITIDKKNQYSGILTWDCSGAESGVYLIRVKYGSSTRTVQVIVAR